MKSDLRVFAETEARLIVYAFLFGLAAGAVYDLFRIMRTFLGIGLAAEKKYTECDLPLIGRQRKKEGVRQGKLAKTLLFAADLGYMLIFAASVTVFYYSFSDGIVRWYTLLGVGTGFYTYMKTVGAVTKKAVGAILFTLTAACRYIWYFGVKPFILLKNIYLKTVGRAYTALLVKRSDALTEKYIEVTLKKKLDEIGSILNGLDDTA